MKRKYFFGILLSLFLLCGGVFLLNIDNSKDIKTVPADNQTINVYIDFYGSYPYTGIAGSYTLMALPLTSFTKQESFTNTQQLNDDRELFYSYTKSMPSSSEAGLMVMKIELDGNTLYHNSNGAYVMSIVRMEVITIGDGADLYYNYDFNFIEDTIVCNSYGVSVVNFGIKIYFKTFIPIQWNTSSDVSSNGCNQSVLFNSYTKNFELYNSDGSTRTVTTLSPLPSRPNYAFSGYYLTTNLNTAIVNDNGTVIYANKFDFARIMGLAPLFPRWTPVYQIDTNILSPSNVQDYNSGTMNQSYNGQTRTGLTDQAFSAIEADTTLTISNIDPATGMYVSSITVDRGSVSVTKSNGIITGCTYTPRPSTLGEPSGGWDAIISINMDWLLYKVRYNANGGSGTMTDQSFTYNTAQNLKSNTFTRAGYYFTDWNGNGTNYTNGQSVINLTTTHNSTIDFYAQWKPYVFTYSFDTDGGSTHAGGTAAYGSSITLPKPDKTGYTFKGWQHGINENIYQAGSYSVNDTANGDVTVVFTAIWQANTYTTTFHDGEGAVTNFADMMITNYNYTYSNNEYSYTVAGVKITYENGTGTLTLNGTPTNAFTIFINTDLSFKQNEQYSVKYTKQEGSMTGGGAGCFVLEICDENWANLSTRNHLDFQMNNTSGEAKLTVNESGETNGKGLRLWFWYNVNATPARVFNNFEIKITLEKLGENQSVIKTGKVTYDSQLRGVSIPSKIGYTFSGYYNSQSGGKQYYKATGVAITETWKETNNITLYAQWTANTYTINYNLGDDDTYPANLGSNAPKSATYNAVIEIPTPTRVGYVFVGWTLSGDSISNSISTAQSGASSTNLSAWDGGANRNRYFKNLTPDASGSVTMTATWQATIASSPSITATKPAKDSNNEYYLISNIDNLAWLALQGDMAKVTGMFRQTNNITIPDNILWLPIGRLGSFSGTYDGQGNTIRGLTTYNGTDANGNYLETNGGLFANASDATIRNVIIEDATIYGQNAGIIAGSASTNNTGSSTNNTVSSTNISNCVVSGTVNGTSIGSIIGNSNGASISVCLAKGVNTASFAGGSASVDSCIYELTGGTKGASGSFNNYSAWIYPSNFAYPMPKAFMWYPYPELTKESLNTWLNR